MNPVFWFDTETTGLDPQLHGIVQLACIIEVDGEIKAAKSFYMNPGKEIDEQALQVNGLTVEKINSFPKSIDQFKNIVDLLLSFRPNKNHPNLIPAGYNVHFDTSFMRQLFTDCNNSFYNYYFLNKELIDVCAISKSKHLNLPNHKLITLCDHLNIPIKNAHNAKDDIIATRQAYYRLQEVKV